MAHDSQPPQGTSPIRGTVGRRTAFTTLAVVDAVLIIVTFSVVLTNRIDPAQPGGVLEIAFVCTLVLAGWFAAAVGTGLYGRYRARLSGRAPADAARVVEMGTLASVGTYAAVAFIGLPHIDPGQWLVAWAIVSSLVLINRTAVAGLLRRGLRPSNVMIIGASETGQLIARKLVLHPELGFNVVGFLDVDPAAVRDRYVSHLPVLGTLDDVSDAIAHNHVDRIVVAFSYDGAARILDALQSVPETVHVDVVPRMYEIMGPDAEVHAIEGMPLVSVGRSSRSSIAMGLKRAGDLALAAGALVVLSPSLAYLALRVKRSSAGPVLYRHERLGHHGRPFRVVKFRTMYLESCRGEEYGGDTAEQHFETLLTGAANSEAFEKAFKFEFDPRVTRFGEFLRKTSLDELPQLVNVIRGEMSLVGPRPITAEELPFYGAAAREVLSVRPGLTGYWQVNGRSDADYPERVRLDSTYVKHWSLKLDCTIIGRTFRVLLADRSAR